MRSNGRHLPEDAAKDAAMTSLLLADHNGADLAEATARALTAARALGDPVDILVAGHDCAAIADAAARLEGVARILVADDPSLAGQRAEPLAALLQSLAPGYGAILASAGSTGKNVLPRLAALLDVMQVSDIVAVVSPDTFRRPIYAGNAVATVTATDPTKVVTVRAVAFAPAGPAAAAAPISAVAVPPDPNLSRIVSRQPAATDRPELGTARTVVSGGRALGSREAFEAVLAPLAGALDAAIGASRAAVDAGYAANDLQVGQTGRVVAPNLYVAVGISGAIQHLAGMQASKIIVAINTDPDAPIFGVADYGLVADLFAAVPELTRRLAAHD
jgi:electron transfer flavoprotein alpha subunit